MQLHPDDVIYKVTQAIRRAAGLFDPRFFNTDQRLEAELQAAIIIIENYHGQAKEAFNTRCSVHEQSLVALASRLELLTEKINNMASDIQALNDGIAGLNQLVLAQTKAIDQILAKNAASPQPIDYTEQINALNAVAQEVKNNTAHIEETYTPAPVVAPAPSVPAIDVPLPVSPAAPVAAPVTVEPPVAPAAPDVTGAPVAQDQPVVNKLPEVN